MRVRAFFPLLFVCSSFAAVSQEREVSLDRDESLQAFGFRLSGFFVGSANYASHVQLVPELAGGAPVISEPGHVDFRFDQFSIGAFRTFAPWLSAGASIEVERHSQRHSHGFAPDFGCVGPDPCFEQFGAEALTTEVSLHRFNVTAVAPIGNGLSLSFGRFDTPFGTERHDAALNLTATTSELQRFGRPQSMTGLQLASQLTPWLDVTAWVVNRWENETTEDPPEDNNRAKSVGGRLGFTPVLSGNLFNAGIGGFWGPEQDGDDTHARFILDADLSWSPASDLVVAGELVYGGESGVSFRPRGTPFPAPAVENADVRWLAAYALAHYDFAGWLGLSLRYGFFDDRDGARTGVAQTLQSITVTPMFHLSRLISELRPPGVTVARTRHSLDWVDLRLEYRFSHSNKDVFSDAAPATPILTAASSGHIVTAQLVVIY